MVAFHNSQCAAKFLFYLPRLSFSSFLTLGTFAGMNIFYNIVLWLTKSQSRVAVLEFRSFADFANAHPNLRFEDRISVLEIECGEG